MRSDFLVAALAAAVSVTSAAGAERPKIYFPRHIKRQYSNTTITSQQPASQGTPLFTVPETTKRESVSELVSEAESAVTTVIIASTIVVTPASDPTPVTSPDVPALNVTATDATGDGASQIGSTAGLPSTIILPTPTETPTVDGTTNSTTAPEVATPTADQPLPETTTSGILLAPTGIVTASESNPTPTLSDPLAPIGSFLSSAVSQVTSAVLPSPNMTDTAVPNPTPTVEPASPTAEPTQASPTETPTPIVTVPTTDLGISLSLPITILPTPVDTPTTEKPTPEPTETIVPPPATNGTDPGTTPPANPVTTPPAGPLTTPPVDPTGVLPNNTVTELPVTDLPPVTTLPISLTTPPVTDLPPVTTLPPDTLTTPPVTDQPTATLPPILTIHPNVTSNENATIPVTVLPPASSDSDSGVTSIPPTGTVVSNGPFIPTTIVVDPSPTDGPVVTGPAPTSVAPLNTGLPKAITPDTSNGPAPDDTSAIQIGFKYGFNYQFVVDNKLAAAQIFKYLPEALRSVGNFPPEKVQMLKLAPLNTNMSLGYVTTLAYVAFPNSLIDQLRMDIRTPASALYNNDDPLTYNLTAQINPAIDIIIGSYPDDGTFPTGSGSGTPGTTGTPNGDLGGNPDAGPGSQTPGQKGATAGIAIGVVGVAAAYGAVMFIVARRYKRKRQAHRRTSSLTEGSSQMRSAAGSPALMGGALLSRDFSSYGGVAGGRDSHGSGRSAGNTSGRTAGFISAPVAAENSLGWN